jgi:hypothetical protein
MAKKGSTYEQFVYEKFRRLFVDSVVTLNDKILGNESGLEREIDVSVRIPVRDTQVLYIVQCKDRGKRPADIVILGEFSAVIRDVGAAKGFLVCTSGFAKSNHRYAQTLGIELVTIEDINSERWKADVQIPLIYVRKLTGYKLAVQITVNSELAEKNRGRPLTIEFGAASTISFDGGATTLTIQEHIEQILRQPGVQFADNVPLDLLRPNLRLNIAAVWVECSELAAELTVNKKIYLKYLTPDEYSQIRDHVRETTLPLHVVLKGTFPILDDTFVEVAGDEPPVFPGLFAQVEEWTDLERAKGLGPQ